MKIVALDIGGTSIKSGLWDGQTLLEYKEWDTNASRGAEYLMERAKEILHTYEGFDAIGVSTAGQVDTTKGSIYYANDNIPNYTGTPIRDMLSEEFHVPVAVENDVNSAALGELYYGEANGADSFLCLTYGTGVGGAIVLDGKVVPGHSFSAGGFGGIVIHPEDMNPEVEFSGCYEKCASTTGLVKRVKKVDETLDNGRKIFAAFDRPEVKKEIDAWIDDITYGLVTLIHTFNPAVILLGGGVLSQPYIISEVRERVDKRISPGFRGTQLKQTGLGNQAGLMGAIHLASKLI